MAAAPRRSQRLLLPSLLAAAALLLVAQLGAPAFLGLAGAPCRPGARGAQGPRLPRAARGGEDVAPVEALKVGDQVEAVFPDDGEWYPGVVEKVNEDGSFDVKWDDPDGGPEVSAVAAESVKVYVPPIPVDDLVVGQKYRGVVRSIAPFGAFVSFGAETDGLVHISAIKEGFVSDIYEEVEVDQEVDVWVKQVRDGKVGLVMVESKLAEGGGRRREPQDLTPFEALSPEEQLEAEVAAVKSFGAFVRVKAPGSDKEAQGLVHISQLSDEFVDDIYSVVEEGQQVTVRVLGVQDGKLSLTMKSA